MTTIRVHAKVESSSVNGPGRRAVIWTQGCTLACAGCWNPETHSAGGGGLATISELLDWIGAIDGIEGITISGGEPMQQPAALFSLLDAVRAAMPQLSIGMFSGYSERELDNMAIWPLVRARLDFAVLGRFNVLKPAQAPLITSSNQKLRLYSDRYTIADFEPQAIEISIDPAGLSHLTGFPIRGFASDAGPTQSVKELA